MSLTSLAFENEIDLRARKALISELWTRDSEGTFFRVAPGGGTPISLPYYLKTNSIKIDNPGVTGNILIDENSIDVNNTVGNTGSSLSSTALTLGDSGGNVTLAKADVIAANKIAACLTAPLNTSILSTAYNLVTYNASLGAFFRANLIRLSKGAAEYSTLSQTLLGVTNTNTNSNTAMEVNRVTSADGSNNMNTMGSGTLICAKSTAPGGTTIDTTQPYIEIKPTYLALKTASTTYNLLKEDIGVTNQLKALTAATPVGTSKMVTFNTATSAFAHADIPTSVAPYAPKLIKLSGKEWKQGDVSATAGLDFTSRALVSGVYSVPTPDTPAKKQQKRYLQWFYNRKVIDTVNRGPTFPTTFTIPAGTIFPGDIIDLEIFSADEDDIISNVTEYAIFIGSPDFSIASLKSLDISATSDNPYLNVTAYPTELAYYSNGVDNTGGVDSFPGIMLTYIYNGRAYLPQETIQHHHLTSFRIQYKGKLMTSVNVTSP